MSLFQNFPDKDPEEIVVLALNFQDILHSGETILAATWSTDPSMTLFHATDITLAPVMRQMVAGGVAGKSYLHKCKVLTDGGRTLVGAGLMKCIIGSAG